MRVKKLVSHFTDKVLKRLEAVEIMTESMGLVETIKTDCAGIESLLHNDNKVLDWNMTSERLYIYIKEV